MFPLRWSIWCVFLTCVLDVSGHDSHEVICSQGLSDCIMKDEMPLALQEEDAVQNLTAYFKLCSENVTSCTLCLVIDIEIDIQLDKDMDDQGHSGHDEEDYSEDTKNAEASVTVCYSGVFTLPRCKKVEFTVNHSAVTELNQAKVSMVISNPAGVFFSSRVIVYSTKSSQKFTTEVVAPSLDEVCSQERQKHLKECRVPRLHPVINQEQNQVELLSAGGNNSLTSVCIQYEQNGRCLTWNKMNIPLYSVMPCMCFQVWEKNVQSSRRSYNCPFHEIDFFKENIWHNVTASVDLGEMNDCRPMLSWNLSAPCRLKGEVWPCHKESSCMEIKGFRQQLENGTWRQNRNGQWERRGVFEEINLQRSPCVMVKVNGMGHELGPFCSNNTDRWRWSLLVVGVMLLVCLTMLIFYLLHDFVKKWVWSWHHGRFVEIGRKRHVVLLSPPDADDGVSESVCRLGSLLCNLGFSVSVDQWSRKEQCTLGPLPWLHSQLPELESHGGRVVLVLTPKALEKAEEWTHKEVIQMKGEDKGLPQIGSPYSDVFTASLCLIQADKQLGRAGERYLLVKFDSHPYNDRSLPELLQGLPVLQLPSQTKALLTELTVGGKGRGLGRRTWKGWKWSASDAWTAKTKKGPDCKYVVVLKNLETKFLEHP